MLDACGIKKVINFAPSFECSSFKKCGQGLEMKGKSIKFTLLFFRLKKNSNFFAKKFVGLKKGCNFAARF